MLAFMASPQKKRCIREDWNLFTQTFAFSINKIDHIIINLVEVKQGDILDPRLFNPFMYTVINANVVASRMYYPFREIRLAIHIGTPKKLSKTKVVFVSSPKGTFTNSKTFENRYFPCWNPSWCCRQIFTPWFSYF